MRPVTSQVAAEIGYDPAGRDRSRALHPAGRRTPSRRRPPLGTPHQQHRPHQRRHRRLSGRDLPSSTPSASISYSPPIPPTPRLQWHTYDHWAETPGAHPTISHYIPAYLGNGGIHLTGVTQIHSSPRAICGWALQARRVSAGRRRRRREGPRVRVGDQVLVPDRRMGRGQLQHPKEHEPAAAGAAAVEAKHKLVQVSGSVRVAH